MKKYHHCVKFTYPLSFQTRIPKVDHVVYVDQMCMKKGGTKTTYDLNQNALWKCNPTSHPI